MTNGKNQPAKGLKMVGEQEVAEYYSNYTGIAMGFYDISILFGLQKIGKTGDPEIEVSARVNMSPQHAKVVCQLLKKNLLEYEKGYGKIVIPKEMCDDLGIKDEL